ncbi:flagellar L-ring protein precursor FlgH [Halanaerobium congolense]|jgi:flagellar L-ring protein precursor FlgH|uniref:Flagellar L-ring protein FlgH n=1 Tax=Halanaerobium congolense TaxID=54121 RepID=A0A1G6RJP9_9FIRM|nr:flagellar basal body L-ring protein FlgH [Halanaerobium congolense]PTX16539.1 flagellar L-ring protein precursor FlgH [Halanaerobium congolense]SDD04207.1 flagellar L-ring protein precursor FlgH [Halanaerobium congolense]SDF59406.1 flagellar L-ring protein precursor FlgH [Halanaerobium congolense]SET00004.1 flagellar L-ring protein precursor FlgH [Halanaerobium congolense]SFP36239.1 flagellar L-ring protein precursor FlgH [Halanaerobium congolense]
MITKKILILFSIILVLVSSAVSANSLWSDNSANFYQDYPEYKIGDIITVVIEEDASAIQSANTGTSQDSDYSSSGGTNFLDFLPFFDFSYSDSESADGSTQRSGTLEADITTKVVKIDDNNNLEIEGRKQVKINGETQTILLSGVIRAEDVNFDNEISSKRVASANVEYEGEGPVGDKQKSGLLTKFFNFVF